MEPRERRVAGLPMHQLSPRDVRAATAGDAGSDDRLNARRALLAMAAVFVTPFVVVGYLGAASLLVLPLLALRGFFPRRPTLLTASAESVASA